MSVKLAADLDLHFHNLLDLEYILKMAILLLLLFMLTSFLTIFEIYHDGPFRIY